MNSGLRRALKTLAAEHLLHLPSVLHDLDLVKVGPKRTSSGLHREAAIASEGRRFSTMLASGHRASFLSSAVRSISSGAYLTTHHPTRLTRMLEGIHHR